MKTVLIIGLGRFGQHLCKKMSELGNEVMAVDIKEEPIQDVIPFVTSAKIGDCTSPEMLQSIGVGNFDICFVCIGTNFQSSLEITSLLKELKAKYVICKATRDIQSKFLLKNGADEVVYPDRDLAEKTAIRCSANQVFDYIELTEEYSIYEIPPLKEWLGRTVGEVDFRAAYHISILGTKRNGVTRMLPGADHIFLEDEHLMVLGTKEDIEQLLKYL